MGWLARSPRQNSTWRGAGGSDYANGNGGAQKPVDLSLRGFSVGLGVERMKSCVTALWGESQDGEGGAAP